jgi:ribosomal protein L24
MSTQPRIEAGDDVFVHDGEHAIGAVRHINARELVVYVENAGDFTVPRTAVVEVEEGKIVLNCGKLDESLRRAIGHAHAAEDPNIP